LLWIGQVVSLLGDWFNTIAVVVLVQRYADSDLAYSALFVSRALPAFFFGPVAGVVADRFNRKTILVASNVIRIFVVLGYLLVDSPGTLWLVFALSVTQFSISAFFEPAYAAILPSVVRHEELLNANTLGSVTWSAMLTLGAAIGGVAVDQFGVQTALIIDAITFAVAAFILIQISISGRVERVSSTTTQWGDMIDGFRYVRQHLDVAVITLVKAISQVGTVDVIVAVYAERVFVVGENGATTLGVMFGAFGLGAVLGPLIANRISDASEGSLKQWIAIGFALMIVGWLTIGLAPSLWIVAVGCAMRGSGGSINWTFSSVLIQMKVPDAYLGRVFGFDFMLFFLALSGSVLFSGYLLDELALDPRRLVLYFAAATLGPLTFWLYSLRWQNRYAGRVTVAMDMD
jgi:MFS family permease